MSRGWERGGRDALHALDNDNNLQLAASHISCQPVTMASRHSGSKPITVHRRRDFTLAREPYPPGTFLLILLAAKLSVRRFLRFYWSD